MVGVLVVEKWRMSLQQCTRAPVVSTGAEAFFALKRRGLGMYENCKGPLPKWWGPRWSRRG